MIEERISAACADGATVRATTNPSKVFMGLLLCWDGPALAAAAKAGLVVEVDGADAPAVSGEIVQALSRFQIPDVNRQIIIDGGKVLCPHRRDASIEDPTKDAEVAS